MMDRMRIDPPAAQQMMMIRVVVDIPPSAGMAPSFTGVALEGPTATEKFVR